MVAFGTSKFSRGHQEGEPTETVSNPRPDGGGVASNMSGEKSPGMSQWACPAGELPGTDVESGLQASLTSVTSPTRVAGAVSLEHWRGEVTSELRHIGQALTRLENHVQRIETEVVSALREHAAYHERKEERWGPLRWCERHPIRFAVVAVAVAVWWLGADSAIGRALVEAFVRALR